MAMPSPKQTREAVEKLTKTIETQHQTIENLNQAIHLTKAQNAEIRAENERLAGLIHDLEIVTRKSKRINYHLAHVVKAIYTKDSLCRILKDSKSKKSAIKQSAIEPMAGEVRVTKWRRDDAVPIVAFAQ